MKIYEISNYLNEQLISILKLKIINSMLMNSMLRNQTQPIDLIKKNLI